MTTPRRPGRPALDPTCGSVNVDLRVSERQYDAIYREAQLRRVTVPQVVRDAIGAMLKTTTPRPPQR